MIVITDVDLARPRSVPEVVREALRAGAPAVQLRDKRAGAGELLERARALLPMVRDAGALLFVNDRLDVALAAGADGVHLGPDDIPVAAARAVVPSGFLVGASTDDPRRARALVADGADYIGCGTVYSTATKQDAGAVIGLSGLQSVAEAVDVPVVGIGGVTAERAAEIATTSASGVAAIAAVMSAADVGAAVRGLLAPWSRRP
ncbi:MAG: thiamine phosphate synthase [Acidobacteria bacterium]|nr:thiamine phosphate synthase [Acidobacteriota bacterium]